MNKPSTVISILGSAGGVAKAILSVLEKSLGDARDPIHSFILHSKILLIDLNQQDVAYYSSFMPRLMQQASLHQFDLTNLEQFRLHLSETGTTHVIDVSWADSRWLAILLNMTTPCIKTALCSKTKRFIPHGHRNAFSMKRF